ncbi:MAG: hypothetical protein QF915_00175 [Candidatus Woesearchaeota archaeon]|jgi:hypothetical protein|nr:hypothetical protein [Candidatus Woesearchaeota archaeon]
MKIRYAQKSDFNFLIEGLEKDRIIEGRSSKDVKAKASDKSDFKKGIRGKTIRIIEEKGNAVAFLYFRTDFKVMYIFTQFTPPLGAAGCKRSYSF